MSIDIDVWKILIYIINVVILFFILRFLLYKPVTRYLNARQERISGQLDDIEKREAEAAELKARYESLIDEAQDQAADIIRKGNETADERGRQIIADAREQARTLVMNAHEDIEREKRIAQQEMKTEIVDMAVEIAGKVLEREVSREDNQKIIDEFFEKVG